MFEFRECTHRAEAVTFKSGEHYKRLATAQRDLAEAESLPLVRAQFLKSAEKLEFLASGLKDSPEVDQWGGWIGHSQPSMDPCSFPALAATGSDV